LAVASTIEKGLDNEGVFGELIMTTGSNHLKGSRIASRSLLGRAFEHEAPGTHESAAIPDNSWDDADHQTQQLEEDDVIDPWEYAGNRKSDTDPTYSQNSLRDDSGFSGPVRRRSAAASDSACPSDPKLRQL